MLLVLTRFYFIIILVFGFSNSFNHGYYRGIIYPTIKNDEHSNLNQRHVVAEDEEYDLPDYTYDAKGLFVNGKEGKQDNEGLLYV